eukprot:755299-Hanusia_phi.AAC.3
MAFDDMLLHELGLRHAAPQLGIGYEELPTARDASGGRGEAREWRCGGRRQTRGGGGGGTARKPTPWACPAGMHDRTCGGLRCSWRHPRSAARSPGPTSWSACPARRTSSPRCRSHASSRAPGSIPATRSCVPLSSWRRRRARAGSQLG